MRICGHVRVLHQGLESGVFVVFSPEKAEPGLGGV